MSNNKKPTFFQKGYSSSPSGQRLQKSAGWINAGAQAFNMLNNAYGATNNVGNALSMAGGVVGSIPSPYTAAAGAILGIAGGIANGFTDTLNEDYKNRINSQIASIAENTSDAKDFIGLQQAYRDLAGTTVDIGDISNWGSIGLFVSDRNSKRAKARNAAIEALGITKETALGNLAETGRTINQANFANQYRNLLAFGGPLDLGLMPIGGAIDYELAQRRLAQRDLEIEAKKALGGPLHSYGADWTNGITIVDNGGTHEQNPFEGVPMGIAPDGQPNLVEEGEVIFNDYVFSNRLKVPKAVREKYKLRGQKEMTFADAAKKAQKESEERPNDPISQRGLEDIMYRLMTEQEAVRESRQQRKYSEGGKIHIAPSKKGTFTAAASKHGMGVQEFASKVLANPEDYSPAMRKKANFARNASKWKHAYGGHLFWDGGFGGDNPFNLPKLKALAEVNSLQIEVPHTTLGHPRFTMGQGLLQTPKLQTSAVETPTNTEDPEEGTTYKEPKTSPLANLRYLPAMGSAINVFTDLMGWTNKPDYGNADMIVDAANQFGSVSFLPIDDYMIYTPLDRLFYANQLGAQAGATRRAILNTSGGNRGAAIAGLLVADYNAQGQLGNLFRQAEEYNLAQREKVAAFKRGTHMFNSEQGLKAAIANRERDKARIDALVKAAAIRDAVDSRVGAARSANLTNLFDSLGNIGIDAYNRQDRDMLIKAGVFGTLSQKPQEWSQKRWKDYQKAMSGRGYRNEGILKKRKGITI